MQDCVWLGSYGQECEGKSFENSRPCKESLKNWAIVLMFFFLWTYNIMFNYKDLRHVDLKLEGRFLHTIESIENNLANFLFVKSTWVEDVWKLVD
jgi:hypothetical protein